MGSSSPGLGEGGEDRNDKLDNLRLNDLKVEADNDGVGGECLCGGGGESKKTGCDSVLNVAMMMI